MIYHIAYSLLQIIYILAKLPLSPSLSSSLSSSLPLSLLLSLYLCFFFFFVFSCFSSLPSLRVVLPSLIYCPTIIKSKHSNLEQNIYSTQYIIIYQFIVCNIIPVSLYLRLPLKYPSGHKHCEIVLSLSSLISLFVDLCHCIESITLSIATCIGVCASVCQCVPVLACVPVCVCVGVGVNSRCWCWRWC